MDKFQTVKEGIVERYSVLVGNPESFAESINKPLKQSFRINTLKGDKDKILEQLLNYDSEIKNVPWNDNGYVSELTNLGSSLEHFVGQIYIQELTSMIPPLIV